MTDCPFARPRDRARMHLAQAETRALSADARDHVRAARRELERLPELAECDDCGRVGLRERIDCHDC